MPPAVNRRLYDNTGRTARSADTRRRVLDAARAQMLERGYRATTVASMAAAAGVNVDTVYALVGRKPVILAALMEQAISGTDRAVPAEDRDYVIAIRAARDAPSKIAIYAAATTEIHERMAPLFLALRDAAATEPEAMSVWTEISARRAANMRLFAADLRSVGGLRRDLTVDEAGDIVWATNSAEVYVMLTVERGWTSDHYRRWLVDTWTRVLTV